MLTKSFFSVFLPISLFLGLCLQEDTPASKDTSSCDEQWLCGTLLDHDSTICRSPQTVKRGTKKDYVISNDSTIRVCIAAVCRENQYFLASCLHTSILTTDEIGENRFLLDGCYNDPFYVDIRDIRCDIYHRNSPITPNLSIITNEFSDNLKKYNLFFNIEIRDISFTIDPEGRINEYTAYVIVHSWNYAYCYNSDTLILPFGYRKISYVKSESPKCCKMTGSIRMTMRKYSLYLHRYCHTTPYLLKSLDSSTCHTLKCSRISASNQLDNDFRFIETASCGFDLETFQLIPEILYQKIENRNEFWMAGVHFLIEFRRSKNEMLNDYSFPAVRTATSNDKKLCTKLYYSSVSEAYMDDKFKVEYSNNQVDDKALHEFHLFSSLPEPAISSDKIEIGTLVKDEDFVITESKIKITPLVNIISENANGTFNYKMVIKVDIKVEDRNLICQKPNEFYYSILKMHYLKIFTLLKLDIVRPECCNGTFELGGVVHQFPSSSIQSERTVLWRGKYWKVICRYPNQSKVFQPRWQIYDENEYMTELKREATENMKEVLSLSSNQSNEKMINKIIQNAKIMMDKNVSSMDYIKFHRAVIPTNGELIMNANEQKIVENMKENENVMEFTNNNAQNMEVLMMVVNFSLMENTSKPMISDMIIIHANLSEKDSRLDSDNLQFKVMMKVKKQSDTLMKSSKFCQKVVKCSHYNHSTSEWKSDEKCKTIYKQDSDIESEDMSSKSNAEVLCHCEMVEQTLTLSLFYKSAPGELPKSFVTLSIIGCFISLALFAFMAFHMIFVIITNPAKRNVANYGYLQFTLSFTILYLSFILAVYSSRCKPACRIYAMFLHYSLLCCFTVMLTIAINLLKKIVFVSLRAEKKWEIKTMYVLSWMLPMMIVFSSLHMSEEKYLNESACFVHGIYYYILMLIIIPINIFAFFVIIAVITKMRLKRDMFKGKTITRDEIVMDISSMLVLGANWLPGCFLMIFPSQKLELAFCLINSFFGIIFFCFYTFYNRDLRSHLKLIGSTFSSGKSRKASSISSSQHSKAPFISSVNTSTN